LIFDALYWDGDTAAASAAASALSKRSTPGATTGQQLVDQCALQQWRVSRGDVRGADAVVAKLLAPPDTSRAMANRISPCAYILDAMAAVTAKRSDALQKVARVDSVMEVRRSFIGIGGLAAARLYELLGKDAQALDAARRMAFWTTSDEYRSTYARERARLAAKLGYSDEAKRYYRLYLLFRSHPEPSLIAERDRIRAELVRLSQEHR